MATKHDHRCEHCHFGFRHTDDEHMRSIGAWRPIPRAGRSIRRRRTRKIAAYEPPPAPVPLPGWLGPVK